MICRHRFLSGARGCAGIFTFGCLAAVGLSFVSTKSSEATSGEMAILASRPTDLIAAAAAIAFLLIWMAGRRQGVDPARAVKQPSSTDLRAFFAGSPIAMFTVDASGRITAWNRAAKRLFGWSAWEVVGTPDPTVPADEDEEQVLIHQRVLSGESIVDSSVARRKKNGDLIEVSVSCSPLLDASGRTTGIVVANVDTAEMKRSARVERERENLRQPSQMMHDVLGVIGHELRTPLAGVRAMAEYLLTEQDRNTEQAAAFLQSINDEVGRMNEMVTNMLEAARLASGRAQWSWKQFHLEQACEEAMEVVRPLIDCEHVRLTCSIVPESCTMRGDAEAVRRLVLNLLSNAVKHTSQGRIAIDVRESASEYRWVQIRVEDSGSGIRADIAQKLGHAFAANSGSIGSHPLKGAGLGLAICRKIAAAHGGRIMVRSEVGRGTTFTALLRADLLEPVIDEGEEEELILLESAA